MYITIDLNFSLPWKNKSEFGKMISALSVQSKWAEEPIKK